MIISIASVIFIAGCDKKIDCGINSNCIKNFIADCEIDTEVSSSGETGKDKTVKTDFRVVSTKNNLCKIYRKTTFNFVEEGENKETIGEAYIYYELGKNEGIIKQEKIE